MFRYGHNINGDLPVWKASTKLAAILLSQGDLHRTRHISDQELEK
jgi:hypothetical protein